VTKDTCKKLGDHHEHDLGKKTYNEVEKYFLDPFAIYSVSKKNKGQKL